MRGREAYCGTHVHVGVQRCGCYSGWEESRRRWHRVEEMEPASGKLAAVSPGRKRDPFTPTNYNPRGDPDHHKRRFRQSLAQPLQRSVTSTWVWFRVV